MIITKILLHVMIQRFAIGQSRILKNLQERQTRDIITACYRR
jgi:hypothetical protein